jgi:transcriptional regulator with XRE-family HTH domain
MDDSIGKRIRTARQAAKLTQERLGEMLGVSSQAVQQWESGRSSDKKPVRPDFDRMPEIAKALGIDLSWLAFGLLEPMMNGTFGRRDSKRGLLVPTITASQAAVDFASAAQAATEWVQPHFPCSPESFRLSVWDRSNYEIGDSIVVDPKRTPAPENMVFAAIGSTKMPVLGSLRIERTSGGLVSVIAPKNKAWPEIVISLEDRIIGVVSEHAAKA